MNNPTFLALILLTAALTAKADSQNPAPQQSPVARDAGSKTVKLCDNKTTVQVANDAPKTRTQGQKISDALMAQWKASQPEQQLGEGRSRSAPGRGSGG